MASSIFLSPSTNGSGASTGTGDLVRANSPTLIAPTLGAALATSIDFGVESYYF